MPTSLAKLGLSPTEEQLDTLAFKCSHENTRTIGDIKKLGLPEIREIYRLSLT